MTEITLSARLGSYSAVVHAVGLSGVALCGLAPPRAGEMEWAAVSKNINCDECRKALPAPPKMEVYVVDPDDATRWGFGT